MVKRTRFTLCLIATAATLAATVPLAGAEGTDPVVTTTYCTGGDTDPWATRLPGGNGMYLSWDDGSVWKDANGVAGVQKTARVCSIIDGNHRVLSTYEEYGADLRTA